MAHNRRLSQFANTVGYNSGKIGFNATNPPRDYCFHSGQADTNIQITNDTTGIDDSAGALIQQDGNDLYIWNKENSFMSLGTNAGEKLRIDSSGRLLLGTTTEGNSAADDLTVATTGSTGITIRSGTSGNGNLFFADGTSGNAALDGYLQYQHANRSLKFGTAATERMRIDSSGRLLVGLTAAREHLNDGSDSAHIFLQGTTQNTSTLAIIRGSDNDGPAHLVLGKTRGTGNSTTVVQSGDTIGHINFEGADGSHLVRAGQISCVVDAAPGGNDMPGRLSFSVTPDGSPNLVERMRINRKGFLKMGPRIKDSSHGAADLDSVRHEFTSDDNGWTMYVQHTSGAASEAEGILIRYRTTSPNGTGNSFIQGQDSNTARFRFASNGGLYNYQSNNSNLCDEREKKNIVSLDSKWDKVKSWDLKKFHYNEDDDGDDLRYGVIAQQVEENCPEVVSDWVKRQAESAVLDEDGNVVTPAVPEVIRKGVKEQQMMWMAIKALQEAQTRIETLEAQVAALQGS